MIQCVFYSTADTGKQSVFSNHLKNIVQSLNNRIGWHLGKMLFFGQREDTQKHSKCYKKKPSNQFAVIKCPLLVKLTGGWNMCVRKWLINSGENLLDKWQCFFATGTSGPSTIMLDKDGGNTSPRHYHVCVYVKKRIFGHISSAFSLSKTF